MEVIYIYREREYYGLFGVWGRLLELIRMTEFTRDFTGIEPQIRQKKIQF